MEEPLPPGPGDKTVPVQDTERGLAAEPCTKTRQCTVSTGKLKNQLVHWQNLYLYERDFVK